LYQSFIRKLIKTNIENMKSLKYLMIAVICIGINACVDGQIRKTVYGNNKVVEKERQAGRFSGIRVSSGIDVFVKQGDKETIVVEADENLHEYILTEIRDDVLHVYTEVNIREAEMKRVYVTMRDIKSIKTTSAGDVIGVTPVKSDNLELSASSAGNIKLEVYAKEIEADISSSGDMSLSGEADVLNADLSSAGDLNAYELKVREADISASSAGDADIYVTERITARASSAGDINYKGDPKYVDAHSSSAGGIHRR
jgi:citrate lyase gamma subunit